jgi:hypothetical protein
MHTSRVVAGTATAAVVLLAALWLASGETIITGSAVADPDAPPALSALERAAVDCVTGDIHVSGEEVTLILDMAVPLYDGGLDYNTGNVAYSEIACVLRELEAPADVTARMDSTRALDGMQEATWGRVSASWTYHPDDGLDVILSLTG